MDSNPVDSNREDLVDSKFSTADRPSSIESNAVDGNRDDLRNSEKDETC